MAGLAPKIDFAVAMSPTEDSTESISSWLPKCCIYNTWRADVVQNILAKQAKQWRRPGGGKQVAIIADDCFYDKKIMGSTLFRELVMNGRHRHILLICCVQYCLDLKPEIRSQLDLVVSTRENMTSVRGRLYEHYFGFFRNQKEFDSAFDACTDSYGCMCVHNGSSSNVLSNNIFWYRAEWPLRPFRLGKRFTFELDKELYQEDEGGGGGDLDVPATRGELRVQLAAEDNSSELSAAV